MIKLKDVVLSPAGMTDLARYQTKVTSKSGYADQVAEAQRLWKSKPVVFDEVRKKLAEMRPKTRRCFYCEDSRATDIEHFRPKTLYPESTFEWGNYLFACSSCNSAYKGEKFAVINTHGNWVDVTRPPKSPIAPPPHHTDPNYQHALINPRFENPQDYLMVDILQTFRFVPLYLPTDNIIAHQRAEYTIETLGLNRDDLVEMRKNAFTHYIGWGDTYLRYKKSGVALHVLHDHQEKIQDDAYLAVWYEMKRTYEDGQKNPRRWSRLKRHERIKDLDYLFDNAPELIQLP